MATSRSAWPASISSISAWPPSSAPPIASSRAIRWLQSGSRATANPAAADPGEETRTSPRALDGALPAPSTAPHTRKSLCGDAGHGCRATRVAPRGRGNRRALRPVARGSQPRSWSARKVDVKNLAIMSLVLGLCRWQPVLAQARDPHEVQPERPTVATHAGTVAPGWIELEWGSEWDRY